MTGSRSSALDPCCGSGALLLALSEVGVGELHGIEVDPVVAEVARVAVPEAQIVVGDALSVELPPVELVVANPPFVAPEAQDKAQRVALRRQFAWLKGRFDLSVPILGRHLAPELALVCPISVLRQGYGEPLRARWMQRYRLHHLGPDERFPGAAVDVALVVLREGPDALSLALQRLPACPLDPAVGRAEVELALRIRGDHATLGAFCEVDTGVVSHGPLGPKSRLLHDEPGQGRVPYVDAMDLKRGRRRWLDYRPAEMHRPKRAELFEGPKLLVQRVGGPAVYLDRQGLYAGHTLTVVRPLAGCPYTLEQLKSLVESPLLRGLVRIEHGARLDLYPKDVRSLPVPAGWPRQPLLEALGLSAHEGDRLTALTAD